MKTLILIQILFIVIGEFVYEGFFHRGLKNLSKHIQTMWLLNFGVLWYYATFNWLLIGIYVLFRILFGGYIWNVSAGQKWNYLGIGWYDKNIEKWVRTVFIWPTLFFGFVILIIKYYEY
jgi:hypothetical protein